MIAYLARRVFMTLPALLGISMLVYGCIELMPGDPVTAMIDPFRVAAAGPEYLATRRAALGLDKPLPERYVLWLNEVAHGNLGYSLQDRRPVIDRVGERLLPTLQLAGAALLLALIIGIPAGIISAVKQYSWLDYCVTIISFAGVSIPIFFFGLIFIYLFALQLRLLPAAGMLVVGAPWTLQDNLLHLIMPATVLSFYDMASFTRYTRSSMLEVLSNDYVMVARSKGLRDLSVILRHALPNALIPLITIISLSLPNLIGGAVTIETIFQWPGMATLLIGAIKVQDFPVIMGVTMIYALLVLASALIADIAYAFADPRIRYT